ncbi:DUF1116 domain-containing protein [Pseudomonas sp. NP21570]|jgi:hypothetical protein|nr:DUF1116 domain-containing protein [Pseudomonas sp. NP21570]
MSEIDAASANHAALTRIGAVRPQWCGVKPAGSAIGLPDFTLLHAGPPFSDPCRPSAPILSSAVLCCLYEGWAANEQEAQVLIEEGRVMLRPAQDFNVVTPLAALVSPKTSLVEVSDAAGEGRSWSLLGSGIGPQLRFGSRAPQIIERLARRDTLLAPALHAATSRSPVDLLTLAEAGLRGGDDLHAQTTHANIALCEVLAAELADAPEVRQIICDTPLFFLTLWMAACKLMLDAAARDADPVCSLVVALAGNGQQVGVRLAGWPQRWVCSAAGVPQGPRMKQGSAMTAPLIGDSGVIDAAGFGAQAWGLACAVAEPMRGWLADPAAGQARWMVGSHPRFVELGLRTGLDARVAAEDPAPPSVAIAMLDAAGIEGLLGRGVCTLDPAFFAAAVAPVQPVDDAGVG